MALVLVAGLSSLLANLVLVPWLGILGAAVALLVVSLALLLTQMAIASSDGQQALQGLQGGGGQVEGGAGGLRGVGDDRPGRIDRGGAGGVQLVEIAGRDDSADHDHDVRPAQLLELGLQFGQRHGSGQGSQRRDLDGHGDERRILDGDRQLLDRRD